MAEISSGAAGSAGATPMSPAPQAAPAQPQQPAKPHHAQSQPRDQGRFAGPPDATKAGQPGAGAPSEPPKPKAWKIGDREVTDPDELYAIASARQVEISAYEQARKEAEELRQYRENLKRNRMAAFETPEEAKRFAIDFIRQQMEEEMLTPEQRQHRQMQRRLQELEQERERQEQERQQRQEQEAVQAARQEFVGLAKQTMEATGLPMTDENLRRFVRTMRSNLSKGLNYPPHVVARQIVQARQQELSGEIETLDVPSLMQRLPGLLKKLDALEDDGALRALAKAIPNLGERLRRLNLEGLGAAATPSVQPGAPAGSAPPDGGSANDRRFHALMQKPREQWDYRDYSTATNLRAKGYSIPD